MSGCDESTEPATERWYTTAQVERGAVLFQANCAGCHGDRAQGLAADWKQRGADGAFPPPPLNGTAHAWHHPRSVLVRSIKTGGIPLGGKMPGFEGRLGDEEILAVIAYFQSFWSDEIYARWLELGGADD
ncbi:MAG: cytochrome c [Gammaproteobacteria bacterium]|nr:cytochrome c [Gammaproteobacteria bacterium]